MGIVLLLDFSYFFPSGIVSEYTREKRMATAVESIKNLNESCNLSLAPQEVYCGVFLFLCD